MSGYFGMLRTDGAPVREDLLQEIAGSLTFRGPDASALFSLSAEIWQNTGEFATRARWNQFAQVNGGGCTLLCSLRARTCFATLFRRTLHRGEQQREKSY